MAACRGGHRSRSTLLPPLLLLLLGLSATWLSARVPLLFLGGGSGSEEAKQRAIEKAQAAIQNADAVCFDVDSTVVKTEGIDILAHCFGVYDEVAHLTKTAMEGNVTFQDALSRRLKLIKPTETGLAACLKKERPKLTRGMRAVVKRLKKRGAEVYFVSGGFHVMIEPVAVQLKVPAENIYANKILFDQNGNFRDFDRTAFTSRSGGKPAAVAHLKKTYGHKTMVMIGDGATDMDARPPADAFIGYGGVVVRPKVEKGADWFIRDWKEMLKVL